MKHKINNLIDYSPIFSNKQNLLFKIINKNDDETYNIKFMDGTIIYNCIGGVILYGHVKNFNSKLKYDNKIKVLFQECYQVAKLCKTRLEFQKKYPNQYDKLKRNKWLDFACKHMIPVKIYTFNDCHKKALLCKTRGEFKKKYPSHYTKAYKRNWLNIY